MTSEKCANRGLEALAVHKELVGDDDPDFFTAVTDLLTDLLHATVGERNPRTRGRCVPEQFMREALNLAEMNFEEERG